MLQGSYMASACYHWCQSTSSCCIKTKETS